MDAGRRYSFFIFPSTVDGGYQLNTATATLVSTQLYTVVGTGNSR
jgi:hypothetical protein